MRLSAEQIQRLKSLAIGEGGQHARLRLFGSRLDDAGGDIDLLLEMTSPVADTAPLVARLAARTLGGRKVDVLSGRAKSQMPANPRGCLWARSYPVTMDIGRISEQITKLASRR